jgi:hypothetical protein
MKESYVIVQETTASRLESEVNSLIKGGYVPVGGIGVIQGTSLGNGEYTWSPTATVVSVSFVQAMMKEKVDEQR